MEKKNLAYLLVCSGDLAFAAANVALGINKYNREEDYDILVYHTGMTERDKRAFAKIPHAVLREYHLDVSARECLV